MALARYSAAWLEQLAVELRSQPQSALLISNDYRVVDCNRQYAQRFSGVSQPLGRYCWEVTHGCGGPCFTRGERCPAKRVIDSAVPWRELHTHRTREGLTRQEVLCVPVFDDVSKLGAVVQYLFDMEESVLAGDGTHPDGLVGWSPAFNRTVRLARRVAPTMATVLLAGESGTGKRRMARAIHRMSGHASKPCVLIDCRRGQEEWIGTELLREFQTESAARRCDGAAARPIAPFRGTLVLSHLDSASTDLQARLLRLLAICRSGARLGNRSAVRVIGTASPTLVSMMLRGAFRADLYFRIGVFSIVVPPLRERREDLAPLAQHFLGQIDPLGLATLSPEALHRLESHDFPGNIAELRSILERANLLAAGGVIAAPHILFQQLPLES